MFKVLVQNLSLFPPLLNNARTREHLAVIHRLVVHSDPEIRLEPAGSLEVHATSDLMSGFVSRNDSHTTAGLAS